MNFPLFVLIIIIGFSQRIQGGCPYSKMQGSATKSSTQGSSTNTDSEPTPYSLAAYLKELDDSICQTEEPICCESPYRTADGSCNNLDHPNWGKSNVAYKRLQPADYDDKISTPRIKSIDGSPLPSSRLVSTTMSPDLDRPSAIFTNYFMQFGQFVSHDITSSLNNFNVPCCSADGTPNSPECFPIEIPKNDNFYAQYHRECMAFIRTYGGNNSCTPMIRQQVNAQTSFIDGSIIYGATARQTEAIRSFSGGKLKSSANDELIFPPQENPLFCLKLPNEPPCFMSGDYRVNMHPGITTAQELFFREHNRVAGILSRINPTWKNNDEKLFQEARRIVVAMFQHITYNEFLPQLLGKETMHRYNLTLLKEGFLHAYDKHKDVTLSNSFGAGSMRFGHTLAQGNFDLYDAILRKQGQLELKFHYYRPAKLYSNDVVDMMVRGLIVEPSQKIDTFFTTGMSTYLFKSPEASYGDDLVAINIQRGRDHGIPSYNSWRRFCSLKNVTNFDDLKKFIDSRSLNAFKTLYKNVEDIDLYLGQLAEIPGTNEVVGPLLNCLLGKEFNNLKFGDRFWYENGGMNTSFTRTQLAEIRKTSLARILCDNSGVMEVQEHVMLLPNISDQRYPCIGSVIPRVNLEAWKL